MRRNTDTRSDLRRPPERSTQRHLLRKSVCGHSIALEDAPAGIRSASAAGMIPVMIPDLAQPDEEVRGLCRYVYPTLLDVIKMLDRENAEAGR